MGLGWRTAISRIFSWTRLDKLVNLKVQFDCAYLGKQEDVTDDRLGFIPAIVMIPVQMNAGPRTRVILAGDPKQLGPITRSPVAQRLGLATSWLDRLMAMPLYDPEYFSGVTFVSFVRFK